MSSGDESDDADLTDGDSSDSDWSDTAGMYHNHNFFLDMSLIYNSDPETNISLLVYYSRLTRHYAPSPQGGPHLWEGPSFVLTRVGVLSFQ